ncbi:RNA-directed DNA polymerase from mobile element jockey [Chionoecetes opilio]|uniref:RNA-directed DNA polymerase from mobile element jockey n=1 Tax=Chionoecetes opilio TaxID=41210 RepID=A0A8J4XZJ3_CHIOP|nr:RNA-directed DNA polymerase from mobile element jockey [Chionoecetes opilio]
MDTFVVALDIAEAFDRVWHRGLAAKLRSLVVRGALLQLIQDYLQDRTLRVVINGHISIHGQQPIHATIPQDRVLGPLLWNVYFNDILQLIPEAQAYADDCTLAFTCDRRDWHDMVCRINLALDNIVTWSNRWQVSLAPDKTQALLISRRQDIANLPVPDIQLEGRSLPLQRSILGVEFDAGLTYTSHARKVAKNSAWRLSCVRRISHLLDAKGVEVLYKTQVRPVMEYSPLASSSCPPSYLATLDCVQRRAQRLVNGKRPHLAPDSFQPLQERRDVAGLCVMHKALNLHTPHLAAIKLPRPPPPFHSTRVAPYRQEQVTVPFSRTKHHLRSFLPRYGRLWNQLVHQTDLHHHASLQDFKQGMDSWLMA